MKLRLIGCTQKELASRAPEILQKAAQALDVVLVEKEPDFQEKAYLPHTQKMVAQLEDWYFQQFNHPLDSLKNDLIRRISGKQIKEQGVRDRVQYGDKASAKTTQDTLQKSRLTLSHLRNIVTNPGASEKTRKLVYSRAIQVLKQTPKEKRGELTDIFMEIRDLASGQIF